MVGVRYAGCASKAIWPGGLCLGLLTVGGLSRSASETHGLKFEWND